MLGAPALSDLVTVFVNVALDHGGGNTTPRGAR